MGAIRFPVIAILLFSACSFAADLTYTINGIVSGNFASMAIVVGLGTAVGIAIAVLSYYASIITNDERSKAGAISEMKSTLINIFIFAFVIIAIGAIDQFFNVLALSPTDSSMIDAITTLYKGNIDYLMPIAKQMVGMYSDASQVSGSTSSVSIYLQFPWGLSGGTSVGRTSTIPILDRLADALSQVTVMIVSIAGQQAMMVNLMKYFITASCQLLLPFGFFLRAIPYVRRAGSTLAAIGITLTLIYPVALFFLGSIMFGIQQTALGTMPSIMDPSKSIMAVFNDLDSSTLAETLSMWSWWMRTITKSYQVVGDLIQFANTTLQPLVNIIVTIIAHLAFDWLGLGYFMSQIFAMTTYSIFFTVNMILSLGATAVMFTAHTLLINNMNSFFLNKGGMATAVNLEYDLAVFGTIVNMTHVLLMASVVLVVLGSIRSLAILLGGEFFLYGLQEYI